MKMIFHAYGNHKKAEVATLISDKKDLKTKNIKRDNEGHYIHSNTIKVGDFNTPITPMDR